MVRCPELDLRSRDLTCVSKKGVLSRRGRHLHNWSKRHVVIASNFIFPSNLYSPLASTILTSNKGEGADTNE